jgi:hypothetical protein
VTSEKRIERIEHLLESLLADRAFDSKVPLALRDAALACNVELRWLRERVSRKEIAAYRNSDDAPWRVFPADIRAFLMIQSNQAPARRLRVLKRAGNGSV